MSTIINIQADEQVNLLMTWVLEERGYDVINVRDPELALGSERAMPDLIIINTTLREGEKRACIEALRALVPNVRILDLGIGAEQAEYDTGADQYLSKPFCAADLIARVATAIG